MNIALVGSSGYIAKYLSDRFQNETNIYKVIRIDQKEPADALLNLLEPEKFEYDVLNDIDFVVFTAAISGPDKCASEFEQCWSVNVTGTSFFIEEAIKRKCHVLFFSSDAVFGDNPGKIYTEVSETKAETPYGRMKKAVEDMFKANPYFKAIRLSYVVSSKDRFISYCLDCIEKGKAADIYHPFYRNCIVVSDVVEVVVWFVFHWDEYEYFALNVAGKELVSRVRIADELNRILGNQLQYKILEPDQCFYQNRPRITQMKSIYIHKYGIIEDDTFTEKMGKELAALTR